MRDTIWSGCRGSSLSDARLPPLLASAGASATAADDDPLPATGLAATTLLPLDGMLVPVEQADITRVKHVNKIIRMEWVFILPPVSYYIYSSENRQAKLDIRLIKR